MERTDRQTAIMKVTDAFRDYANAHTNERHVEHHEKGRKYTQTFSWET